MDQRVHLDHVDPRDDEDQMEPRDQLEIQESQDHVDLVEKAPKLMSKVKLHTAPTSCTCT